MNFPGKLPSKPAALALAFSAARSSRNIVAVASCSAALPNVHSEQPSSGNDDTLGTTTTLLVRRARSIACAEYHDFSPRNPCCNQITPSACTDPSACVG